MRIDVSVVIPTYNTGPKLEPLLVSLAAQSLPDDRYEVIVVDDGSTDDTWDRLQALTTQMANLRVERIPNSGWPGRPRNVGTDLARGRYVFYSDHDDGFFPEALERMVAMADRAEADVVIGKEVRSGALGIGAELFLRDCDRADLFADDVLALITPHKLFRTSFLREQGIRFPEGRRRLEDHVLLAEVYTRTDRIAVLASYPCYRWVIYPDGSNNSSSLGDLRVYFDSLADVFSVLENADVPPERRDALIRFWYATRMLRNLFGYWFEDWPEDYRDDAIKIIGELAAERVPARLDHGLDPVLARRAALLRSGDRGGLLALAHQDHRVHLRVDSSSYTWTSAGLRVDLTGTLVDRDDEVLLFTAHDEGLYFPDDHVRQYNLRPFLEAAGVDLFLKQHRVGTEWYAATPAPLRPRATEDGTVLEVAASFLVDPASFVFGRPLDDGQWSIYLHTRAFGYQSRLRLTGGAEGAAVLNGLPLLAAPNNVGQTLLSVGSTPRFLQAALGPAEASGRGSHTRIRIDLPGVVVRGAESAGLRLRIGREEVTADVEAGSPVRLVAVARVPRGVHDITVVLGDRTSRPLLTVHAGRPWQRVRTGPSLVRRVARRLTTLQG